MTTRWRAVDLFDQHATRRFSSGARAVDEHARNGAADLRSIRLRIRETRHELTVTVLKVGESPSACHLLYVSASEMKRSAAVLLGARGASMFTVSDADKRDH